MRPRPWAAEAKTRSSKAHVAQTPIWCHKVALELSHFLFKNRSSHLHVQRFGYTSPATENPSARRRLVLALPCRHSPSLPANLTTADASGVICNYRFWVCIWIRSGKGVAILASPCARTRWLHGSLSLSEMRTTDRGCVMVTRRADAATPVPQRNGAPYEAHICMFS